MLDPETEALGAAHLWRLGLSLADLSRRLEARGARLVLRRGAALDALRALVAETGARTVRWSRLHDGAARARDQRVKAALRADGIEARSANASLLFEPWTVSTGAGGFYKVFTPFWRAVRERPSADPLPIPALGAPARWPRSDRLEDWAPVRGGRRWTAVLARHARVGEEAARARLDRFVATRLDGYAEGRDRPALEATSNLSEHLALGEISPRTIRAACERPRMDGSAGAELALKQLAWREFAYHLLHHSPRIETRAWRDGWDRFPWRGDNPDAERWRRGMTGEPMVDAAMREMHVTGRMANRGRMIAASYLTKHLLTDWRIGMDWFARHLTDWDPASNAMGWQWTAGCGPDAAPYFRIFNPAVQARRFDPDGAYRARFLRDPARPSNHPDADAFFDAAPRRWGLDPDAPYPAPAVDLNEGRARALAAYRNRAGGSPA